MPSRRARGMLRVRHGSIAPGVVELAGLVGVKARREMPRPNSGLREGVIARGHCGGIVLQPTVCLAGRL